MSIIVVSFPPFPLSLSLKCTVTLRPAQGANLTLRGFLIQGRTQLDNVMVGTFADPAPLNSFTQLSLCTPRNVGVTHNNPGPAAMRIDNPGPLTFTWTAPAAGTGPIWFRYTIMQNVSTWWADDSSAIVQEGKRLSQNCVHKSMHFL